MELNMIELQKLIDRCLREDLGAGDLTTNSTVPADAVSTGYILAKEAGVVAGLPLAEMVFRRLDPSIEFRPGQGRRPCERGRVWLKLPVSPSF